MWFFAFVVGVWSSAVQCDSDANTEANTDVAASMNETKEQDSWLIYYVNIFLLYAILGAILIGITRLYHSSPKENFLGVVQRALQKNALLRWFNTTPDPVKQEGPARGSSGGFARNTKLALCFCGLQCAYLLWGFLQERIMTLSYDGDHFTNSEGLVLINRTMSCVVAYIVMKYQSPPSEFAPPYKYCVSSVSNILSTWFQYEALKFVSFPLQVLSKSSKILFAMLMGRIVQNKTYPWTDYVSAILIMFGLAMFKWFEEGAPTKKVGEDLERMKQIFGAGLLIMYVSFDSFNSNYQKVVFDGHKVSPYQMMFGINLASAAMLAPMLTLRGVLTEVLFFSVSHPIFIIHSSLMSICSAVGQLFIFYTIKEFGVVTFSSIMTTRQFLAILLSMFYYGHHITSGSAGGLALVFMALGGQVYLNSQKSPKPTQGKLSPSVRAARSKDGENPEPSELK